MPFLKKSLFNDSWCNIQKIKELVRRETKYPQELQDGMINDK